MTQFVLYLGLKVNGNNLVAILSKLYLTVRGIIISILQSIGQFSMPILYVQADGLTLIVEQICSNKTKQIHDNAK